MTLSLDAVRRTSTIDPHAEPMTVEVDYSGALNAVELRFGGSSGTLLGTGAAGAGTITGTIPLSGATINAAGSGGVSGLTIVDPTAFTSDGIQTVYMPLGPDAIGYTQLSGAQFAFDTPNYEVPVADLSPPQAHPFDYWPGTPGLTTKTALSGVFIFTMSAPYTSVVWDFGDGATSTALNPTHTYTSSGTFFVTLTAYYSGLSPASLFSITALIVVVGGWSVGRIGMAA